MKIILITGTSSGIGFATALALKKQGHKVYGGVRNEVAAEKLKKEGIIPCMLDVTKEHQCRQALDTILKYNAILDVLINNAGYGLFGAIEDISIKEAKHQFDVNVFAVARLCQMALPVMRAQKSGRIINISSVGGRMVSFMGGWYHASKYAVEAYSDVLRMEVSEFGIDVVLIEPGGTKTNWWEKATKSMKSVSTGSVYEKVSEKAADGMMKLYKNRWMSDPSIISRTIMKAVEAKRPKTRYVVGFGGKSLLFMHWLLPAKWYDWLVKHTM